MVQKNIRETLQSIAILTRKKYSRELRKLNLHIGQELALFHLWEKDGISQSELRKKTGTKASTMSNMLNKLENDEIIYRQRDSEDQRVIHVFLTEKGKKLQASVEELWKAHEDALLAGILEEEKLFLRRLLNQIEDNLREERE